MMLPEAKYRILCGCRLDQTVSIENFKTSQLEPTCQFLYVASVLAMIDVDALRFSPWLFICLLDKCSVRQLGDTSLTSYSVVSWDILSLIAK